MKIQITVAALLLAALALPGSGTGRIWWSGSSRTGAYDLEVLVDGAARGSYSFRGHDYVEGRVGERYVIRVHNRTWRRIEAVVAVDGRDVIDGRAESLSLRGYVIAPYSYVDIDGFRVSIGEVAAFRFTTVPDSYAARMGTPWEVGVIGVAIFPERNYQPPRPRPPYVMRDEDSVGGWAERKRSAPAAEAAPGASQGIGTQFGERRDSPVMETRFERENWHQPAARLSLRYEDREGLCSIGLGGFCYPPYYPHWSPPYEPEPPAREFSQPPPGWEHFSQWY